MYEQMVKHDVMLIHKALELYYQYQVM